MKSIPLTQGKTAIVDDEDYEWLSQWKWRCSPWGYAIASSKKSQNRKTFYMHRLIMGYPSGKQVDHVNGNKLDNRRCNLRTCTGSENQINRGTQRNNTSGYKGVSWDKSRKKWTAAIQVSGKTIHLGRHDDLMVAARAYSDAAIKYFGEFAPETIRV